MRGTIVEGRVIRILDEGPSSEITLVFSNSLGTDLRVWDALLPYLPPGGRHVRYDKRGHGLSDLGEPPYTIDDHVTDLSGVLDCLGIEQAVVVGLSVGGLIAQGLAAADSMRVRGLVLMDTAHRIGTPAMWDERMAAVRAGGIEAIAEGVLERWFSADFRANRANELALWRNMLVRTPAGGYLGTSAAIRDADFTAAAGRIAVPTLCLVGTEDGSTPPALVRELADLIPGALYREIEGAGHLPGVEAPEAVGAAISDFLQDAGLA